MDKPIELKNIRNITVSGRIASGSTTLARHLAKILGWRHIEGGEVFWEEVRARLGLASKDTGLRPDKEDTDFDASLKKLLTEEKNMVVETKLAGFNAQGIDGIFKILVVCDNENGADQTEIRVDRLINREEISIEEAKQEVIEREEEDLKKWRKLYADGNENWVYWDRKYYDLVVNTYSHNQEESLEAVLSAISFKKD